MHGKIMVWGLGNPLQGDDRAGIEVARELLINKAREIIPIICETTPGNFIPLIEREQHVAAAGQSQRQGQGQGQEDSSGSHGAQDTTGISRGS